MRAQIDQLKVNIVIIFIFIVFKSILFESIRKNFIELVVHIIFFQIIMKTFITRYFVFNRLKLKPYYMYHEPHGA